jgi:6-phosphogluconate dehydrogenase
VRDAAESGEDDMQIGMIGLGRMGMNMTKRLMTGGHRVAAYNRTPRKTDVLAREGAVAAYSLAKLVEKLSPPRCVWIMLPAGQPVDDHVDQLRELLSPGDVVIDGGNTYYKDDLRRERFLSEKGISLVDVGVSGGVWGLENGYCLTVGGPLECYRQLEPVFETLAPPDGYLNCGGTGAGHFVKMVHNGIEYGMMQAYGEGFEILEASPYAGSLDLAEVAQVWNNGSVIRSWLLELAQDLFSRDGRLTDIEGIIDDSGEGRWAVQQAIETGVAAPVTTLSLIRRLRSRNQAPFSDRLVAALRREFGGHPVQPASPGKRGADDSGD